MGDMIEGVIVQPLKVISDERGSVMHMIRKDSSLYREFGEIYFSSVNPGVIKGWKKHLKMTQHYAVPVGNIKLVLYDERAESNTYGKIQEVRMGEDNYCLVKIPPGIWYAFSPEGGKKSLIANCTDIPHDPGETISVSIAKNKIPYKWEEK